MKIFWRILKDVIMATIIILSLLLILTSLNIGAYRMFVVKSGSMEPKIKIGSIVFDQRKNNYQINDVITFKIKNSKDTVTHRIVEIKTDAKNDIFFSVKGDVNNSPDEELVPVENVVGRVLFSIPYVGYLISFVKTLPGIIILIIIPTTIIIYEEIGKIKEEIKKIRKEAKKLEESAEKEEKKIVGKIKLFFKRKGRKK